jgi:2-isopropylmalate synthase
VEEGGVETLEVTVSVDGVEQTLRGQGNGPIDSFVHALAGIGIEVRVLDYHEHATGSGADAKAAAYIEAALGEHVLWGVGIHESIVTASLKAVASAVNRAARLAETGRAGPSPALPSRLGVTARAEGVGRAPTSETSSVSRRQ